MTELCGNVVENKGPASEAAGRNWNVIENKGSYALEAGMLLKINEVGGRKYVVGRGRAGSRWQVAGGRRGRAAANLRLLAVDC
jgi:hypothetical protein